MVPDGSRPALRRREGSVPVCELDRIRAEIATDLPVLALFIASGDHDAINQCRKGTTPLDRTPATHRVRDPM